MLIGRFFSLHLNMHIWANAFIFLKPIFLGGGPCFRFTLTLRRTYVLSWTQNQHTNQNVKKIGQIETKTFVCSAEIPKVFIFIFASRAF